MNDPPQCENVAAKGDVLESTNISDDSPPKFVSVADVSSHVADDDVFEEILFEDESTMAKSF